MKTTILLSSMILLVTLAFGQEDKHAKNIKNAIDLHHEATDSYQELIAAQTLKHLSDMHPDDWRPAYWAAFVYTQAGRLSDDQLPYYDTAQILLNKAMTTHKNQTKLEKSEYLILQSLIYNLQTGPHWQKGDREAAMKFTNLMLEERQKAVRANPNNPRVLLLMGTGYISEGKRRKDPSMLLAGKVLLEEANRKYNEFPAENELAPNWGKGWINYWLSNIGDIADTGN